MIVHAFVCTGCWTWGWRLRKFPENRSVLPGSRLYPGHFSSSVRSSIYDREKDTAAEELSMSLQGNQHSQFTLLWLLLEFPLSYGKNEADCVCQIVSTGADVSAWPLTCLRSPSVREQLHVSLRVRSEQNNSEGNSGLCYCLLVLIDRVCVFVCVWERLCVVRERPCVCVCCERERESVCVCVCVCGLQY